MHVAGWIVLFIAAISGALAGVGTGAPAGASPSAERETFAARLAAALRAGDADAALGLVRSERVRVPEVLEDLLLENGRLVLREEPDSARGVRAKAETLARLFFEAHGDSLGLRMLERRRGVPRDALPVVVSGWTSYREAKGIMERSGWNEVVERSPALLAEAEASGDPFLRLRVLQLVGRAAFITHQGPGRARELHESALALARELGDRPAELRILVQISMSYQAQDQPRAALEPLLTVVEPARAMEDWSLAAHALTQIGINDLLLGELDEARTRLEEAVEISKAHGLAQNLAQSVGQLGDVLGLMGRYEEAAARREEALRLAREGGYRLPELGSIIALGWIYNADQRHSRALALLREGLTLALELGHHESASILTTEIGETYEHLGRPEEALRHYEAALPRAREMGIQRLESSLLRSMAAIDMAEGRAAEAVSRLERAVDLVQKSEIKVYQAGAHLDLGEACTEAGFLDRAEAHLAMGRSIADSLGNPLYIAEADRGLGRLRRAQGRPREALPFLDRAIVRSRVAGLKDVLREALADKAEIRMEEGHLRETDSLLAEAIDLLEEARERQGGSEIRVGFFRNRKEIFVDRVAVLHRLGLEEGAAHREEAFTVAERSLARTLLEALSGSAAHAGEEIPEAIRNREALLEARIERIQSELTEAASAEAWNQARMDSLEAARARAVGDYRQVLDEIAAGSVPYAALAGHRPVLEVRDVRERVLGTGQVLLEYLVGGDRSFVFVVGRTDLRLIPLPVGEEELRGLVEALRRAMLDSDRLSPAAQALNDVLIGPLDGALPADARLLIVPDGALHYLPWAALHDGERYLVERHALAFAPSASVLDPEIRRRRPGPASRMLAVGNPASLHAEELLAGSRDADRWRFGELPYAEEEARRVAARFPGARVLVGSEADEATVKGAIGEARYVHFATHGFVDEGEPLMSGLALAQGEGRGAGEDGYLQTHEVLKLRLGADLVALSACNTGLGRMASGEGVLGLTRAFLHAGAGAVLLSLWEVGDRSTLDLMDAFYGSLAAEDVPADESLRRAQLAAIEAGEAPREWGAFVLMGAADLGGTGGSAPPLRVLLAAGLLVLLGGVAVKTWRNRHA